MYDDTNSLVSVPAADDPGAARSCPPSPERAPAAKTEVGLRAPDALPISRSFNDLSSLAGLDAPSPASVRVRRSRSSASLHRLSLRELGTQLLSPLDLHLPRKSATLPRSLSPHRSASLQHLSSPTSLGNQLKKSLSVIPGSLRSLVHNPGHAFPRDRYRSFRSLSGYTGSSLSASSGVLSLSWDECSRCGMSCTTYH